MRLRRMFVMTKFNATNAVRFARRGTSLPTPRRAQSILQATAGEPRRLQERV